MNKDKKKPDKPGICFKSWQSFLLFLIAVTVIGKVLDALSGQARHQENSANECRARNGAWVVQIQNWMGYCEEPSEGGSAAAMFIPFLTILTTARRNDDDEPKTMCAVFDGAVAASAVNAKKQICGRARSRLS